MDYLKNTIFTVTDKLGDATIYALDEMKFWGEVLVEYMEWDKTSSDNMLDDFRKELRDQLKEHEEIDKAVEEIRKEQEIDNNASDETNEYDEVV
jgi:hypothetical protein